jgi:hypothetical protein
MLEAELRLEGGESVKGTLTVAEKPDPGGQGIDPIDA